MPSSNHSIAQVRVSALRVVQHGVVLAITCLLLVASAQAQRSTRPVCTAPAIRAAMMQHPAQRASLQELEAYTAAAVRNAQLRGSDDTIITIPVVVHVLYRTEAQNISDAQIQTQIDVLNADFARLNPDTSLTPDTFKLVTRDTHIRFCRATMAPDSTPTTGITRTQTTVQNIGNGNLFYQTALGGHDAWNRDYYLNIWVCELQGQLGFASPPGGPANDDGVVVGFEHFGTNGTAQPPYNGGRTCTHEVGHWLNLIHIWGDDGGTCTSDDFVADTPEQGGNYVGCPVHPQVSCGTEDMFMNYMDNTDDACMNLFSEGQRVRMRAALTGARSTLLQSHGCDGDAWPSLIAWLSASTTSVIEGASIDFTDQSSGGPISWQWAFEGAQPANSVQTNPAAVVYPDSGTYDVQLIVSDGTLWDTLTLTDYIQVLPVQPCDTLEFPLTGTQELYLAPVGGYVAGSNGYNDRAKANYFDAYAPYSSITGALFRFSRARDTDGDRTATFVIWDSSGPDGEPGNIIGTTTLPYDQIVQHVADSELTYVSFTPPVIIPANFYLGLLLDTTFEDTLALYTNTDGDTNPGTAWELWDNNTWRAYSDSWALNVRNTIYPIVCGPIPDGIETTTHQQHRITVVPNPSTGLVMLKLPEPAERGTLAVYNLAGQPAVVLNNHDSGHEIDLRHLEAGTYVLRFRAQSGVFTGKLLIAR